MRYTLKPVKHVMICRLGPVDLTVGTLFPSFLTPIPTVTDTLFSEGTISTDEVGISFEPITSGPPQSNGELTFGGTDSTRYTGAITYTPISELNFHLLAFLLNSRWH